MPKHFRINEVDGVLGNHVTENCFTSQSHQSKLLIIMWASQFPTQRHLQGTFES